MKDAFESMQPGLTSPLVDGFSVSPDDASDLPSVTRALYVGQTGDVAVTFLGGGSAVLRDMQAGTVYPLRVRRVSAAGTTAQNLIGLV